MLLYARINFQNRKIYRVRIKRKNEKAPPDHKTDSGREGRKMSEGFFQVDKNPPLCYKRRVGGDMDQLLSKLFPPIANLLRVENHVQLVPDSRIHVDSVPESGIGRVQVKPYKDAIERIEKTGESG